MSNKETTFKVTTNDWKKEVSGKTPYQWDVQLESIAVLLALRLAEVRGLDPRQVVHELNYQFIAKGRRGVKGKKINYIPTQWQRWMLKNKGY